MIPATAGVVVVVVCVVVLFLLGLFPLQIKFLFSFFVGAIICQNKSTL